MEIRQNLREEKRKEERERESEGERERERDEGRSRRETIAPGSRPVVLIVELSDVNLTRGMYDISRRRYSSKGEDSADTTARYGERKRKEEER